MRTRPPGFRFELMERSVFHETLVCLKMAGVGKKPLGELTGEQASSGRTE